MVKVMLLKTYVTKIISLNVLKFSPLIINSLNAYVCGIHFLNYTFKIRGCNLAHFLHFLYSVFIKLASQLFAALQ